MAIKYERSFRVAGLVSGVRPLVSKGQTFGYSVKIATLGETFEVQTREQALAESVGDGLEVIAVGRLERRKFATDLVVEKFLTVDGKEISVKKVA